MLLLLLSTTPARADESTSAWQKSYELETAGRSAEALATLEKLPASGRETYLFHLRRGWLLYLAGKNAPSIEAYRAAMSKAPRALEPKLGALLPMLAASRFTEAATIATLVLAEDPKNATALGKLAWARYNEGRLSDAEAAYRKVLDLYPSDVDLRVGLGWSLLKLGRAVDAAAELRAVLQVAPKHATALAGLTALGQNP